MLFGTSAPCFYPFRLNALSQHTSHIFPHFLSCSTETMLHMFICNIQLDSYLAHLHAVIDIQAINLTLLVA